MEKMKKGFLIEKAITDNNNKLLALIRIYADHDNIIGVSVDGDLLGRTLPLSDVRVISWNNLPAA